jgi:hypothetical protein
MRKGHPAPRDGLCRWFAAGGLPRLVYLNDAMALASSS